jgi:hypothetical protein
MLIYVNTYWGFLWHLLFGLAPSCLGPLYALILVFAQLTKEKRKGAGAPLLFDDSLFHDCVDP